MRTLLLAGAAVLASIALAVAALSPQQNQQLIARSHQSVLRRQRERQQQSRLTAVRAHRDRALE